MVSHALGCRLSCVRWTLYLLSREYAITITLTGWSHTSHLGLRAELIWGWTECVRFSPTSENLSYDIDRPKEHVEQSPPNKKAGVCSSFIFYDNLQSPIIRSVHFPTHYYFPPTQQYIHFSKNPPPTSTIPTIQILNHKHTLTYTPKIDHPLITLILYFSI